MTKLSGPACTMSFLLLVITATAFSASVTHKSCIDHFTIEGIQEENITKNQGNITIGYYIQKDNAGNNEPLYTIHWDEVVVPNIPSSRQKFFELFSIEQADQNTWKVYARQALIGQYSEEEIVELTSTFGSVSDLQTCTVILRHILVSQETRQLSQVIEKKPEDKIPGIAKPSINLEQPIAKSSAHHPQASISISNQKGLLKKNVHNTLLDNDVTVSVTFPSTSVTDVNTNGEAVSSNYKIAVGIIGGIVGLALVAGIAGGLYHNYKRNNNLGLFRQATRQQISLLGSAYPNIAMSNTDMRLNARDAYEPSSTTYPNYGFANPAAIDDAPTEYKPELI